MPQYIFDQFSLLEILRLLLEIVLNVVCILACLSQQIGNQISRLHYPELYIFKSFHPPSSFTHTST